MHYNACCFCVHMYTSDRENMRSAEQCATGRRIRPEIIRFRARAPTTLQCHLPAATWHRTYQLIVVHWLN